MVVEKKIGIHILCCSACNKQFIALPIARKAKCEHCGFAFAYRSGVMDSGRTQAQGKEGVDK